MTEEELKDYQARFLFGELGEEDELRLEKFLNETPEQKKIFQEFLKLNLQLEDEFSKEVKKEKIITKRGLSKKVYLLAAALLLAALGGYFLTNNSSKETPERKYLTRIIDKYSDCKIDNISSKKWELVSKNQFELSTSKASYCKIQTLGGHSLIVELEPESSLSVVLEKSKIVLSLKYGSVRIDSNKLEPDSKLYLSVKDLMIDFLGTRVRVSTNEKISKVITLEGAVEIKSKDIIATNKAGTEGEYSHQNNTWNEQEIDQSLEKELKEEFNSIGGYTEDVLKQEVPPQIVQEIFTKKVSKENIKKKITKILGKKVVLKNGKQIITEEIFQDKDNYILITKDDMMTISRSEVETILFQ
ncbi:MAG: FecR domain-containing protein [Leptospiraceae bacterium]|nr:FecR domain-containing protein [Leptospiraceae bacterium]